MRDTISSDLLSRLRQNRDIAIVLDRYGDIALPDCWLVAGCLAQTVWNLAAGAPPMAGIRDIDIVYHDPTDLSATAEAAHEARLRAVLSGLAARLDVKNQARVHLWYEARFGRAIAPYRSTAAAIATYPSTATAIGIRMQGEACEICAPFGLTDLLAGVVRPNRVLVSQAAYQAKAARWGAQWPGLRIIPWQQCE
jgi:hypothetical protein